MKLIVGLGNPGRQYARTRHNVGFRIVDLLAEKLGSDFDRKKFKAEYAEGRLPGTFSGPASEDDEKLMLLKPQTFMNLSGEAVISFMGYFKIDHKALLVVVDDVALPVGRMRLRKNGSSGSHNGLRDIERVLGRNDYARLRVGVGGREEGREHPPDLAGHVLGRFSEAEEVVLDKVLSAGSEACLRWAGHGPDTVMNEFNAKEFG